MVQTNGVPRFAARGRCAVLRLDAAVDLKLLA
jgi:hypothetical protein